MPPTILQRPDSVAILVGRQLETSGRVRRHCNMSGLLAGLQGARLLGTARVPIRASRCSRDNELVWLAAGCKSPPTTRGSRQTRISAASRNIYKRHETKPFHRVRSRARKSPLLARVSKCVLVVGPSQWKLTKLRSDDTRPRYLRRRYASGRSSLAAAATARSDQRGRS